MKFNTLIVGGIVGTVLVVVGLYFFLNTRNQSQSTGAESQVEEQTAAPNDEKKFLSGTYRCWSFNNSAGGGSCRTPPQPALIVSDDGTYSLSSERGTYEIRDGMIYLSESKIRGPGTLLENNMQIRFEYDYNVRHYTVTYLKQEE